MSREAKPSTAEGDEDDGLLLPTSAQEDTEPKKPPTVAQQLVTIALDEYTLGRSEEGRPFATLKDGPLIGRTLGSGATNFSNKLAATFHARTGRVAGGGALNDAVRVLMGLANAKAAQPLHLRVGRLSPTEVVVDLGDEEGSAVVLTPEGWNCVDRSPLLFRRTELTSPLPRPTRGDSIDALRPLLNCDDEMWPQLVAWLVASFIPDIPHPVLLLSGEQGSAKTAATNALLQLIDPAAVGGRRIPRDPDSWSVTAAGSWAVALENVSYIPDWLSDALCRAVTGDGDVRRKLYTDGDLHIERFRRVVIINGIEVGGVRGDLADRTILWNLDRIADVARREEASVRREFARLAPGLLGALFDLVVVVLRANRDGTNRMSSLPRMADYARVVRAVDMQRRTDALSTYLARSSQTAADVAEDDEVTQALRMRLEQLGEREWVGTPGELLQGLGLSRIDRPSQAFPKSPKMLSQRLKLLAPGLRESGWTIEQGGRSNGVRLIRVQLPDAALGVSGPAISGSHQGRRGSHG